MLAILLANNYDVMSRVRDEGRLSYKINTIEQVRVSQSVSQRGEKKLSRLRESNIYNFAAPEMLDLAKFTDIIMKHLGAR